MFHWFCLVIFQVIISDFTVPNKAKLEEIVMDNFERITVSATTKLSDIDSLSIIVGEWELT